jgi:hypothetical protein
VLPFGVHNQGLGGTPGHTAGGLLLLSQSTTGPVHGDGGPAALERGSSVESDGIACEKYLLEHRQDAARQNCR